MCANQLRLYFSSLAYVLVQALRRLGLTATEWATAPAETIRLRLLKIAAQVRVSARCIQKSTPDRRRATHQLLTTMPGIKHRSLAPQGFPRRIPGEKVGLGCSLPPTALPTIPKWAIRWLSSG